MTDELDVRPRTTQSPLQRTWNIVSAVLGVIGTAGMIDDIVAWSKFIGVVIDGYQSIVHPILSPVVNFFGFGEWAKDYLFVGILVSSAKVRAIHNNLHGHWGFDTSRYSWWHLWAPHNIASLLMGVLAAVFWPIVATQFLPIRFFAPDPKNLFQVKIRADQNQWLMIYALLLVLMLAANAGLIGLAKV
jgi:hypothetical protein